MQPTVSAKDKILHNVRVDSNGCWLWQLRVAPNGYGHIWLPGFFEGVGPNAMAHRASYKVFKGNIPSGYQIDHLCKVRSCVNPDHLEAVTAKENVSRSDHFTKKLAARTHCPAGHEYSVENTYIHRSNRHCVICRRSALRRSQAKKRMERLAYAAD